MPLQTFWRPIPLEEVYDGNLSDKRYFKQVNPAEDIDQTIGQYLAKPLRDEILKTQQDKLDLLR